MNLIFAVWWADAMGWFGFVVLLISFVYTMQEGFGLPRFYYWLNLLGAIGIGTNSYMNGAMPSAILNVIWSLAAIVALVIVEVRLKQKAKNEHTAK